MPDELTFDPNMPAPELDVTPDAPPQGPASDSLEPTSAYSVPVVHDPYEGLLYDSAQGPQWNPGPQVNPNFAVDGTLDPSGTDIRLEQNVFNAKRLDDQNQARFHAWSSGQLLSDMAASRQRGIDLQNRLDAVLQTLSAPAPQMPTQLQQTPGDTLAEAIGTIISGGRAGSVLNSAVPIIQQRQQIAFENQMRQFGLTREQAQMAYGMLTKQQMSEQEFQHQLELAGANQEFRGNLQSNLFDYQDVASAQARFEKAQNPGDADAAAGQLAALADRLQDPSLALSPEAIQAKKDQITAMLKIRQGLAQSKALENWRKTIADRIRFAGGIRDADLPDLDAQRQAIATTYNVDPSVLQKPVSLESQQAKALKTRFSQMTPYQAAQAAYHAANVEIALQRVQAYRQRVQSLAPDQVGATTAAEGNLAVGALDAARTSAIAALKQTHDQLVTERDAASTALQAAQASPTPADPSWSSKVSLLQSKIASLNKQIGANEQLVAETRRMAGRQQP